MDMNEKVKAFATAISDVYREEGEREIYAFQKLELKDDFTGDLTAMLIAMQLVAQKVTRSNWDIIDFTHVLNKIAVQYVMDEKEETPNDD